MIAPLSKDSGRQKRLKKPIFFHSSNFYWLMPGIFFLAKWPIPPIYNSYMFANFKAMGVDGLALAVVKKKYPL